MLSWLRRHLYDNYSLTCMNMTTVNPAAAGYNYYQSEHSKFHHKIQFVNQNTVNVYFNNEFNFSVFTFFYVSVFHSPLKLFFPQLHQTLPNMYTRHNKCVLSPRQFQWFIPGISDCRALLKTEETWFELSAKMCLSTPYILLIVLP